MNLRNIATVYIFDENRILLMHRVGSRLFNGSIWVGIGGHFEEYELNDPEACALRELCEETGLSESDIDNLHLKYITMRMTPDEIRQQYIFTATLKNKTKQLIKSDEGELHWIPTNELFDRKMAFSNIETLKHFFAVGKYNDSIYTGTVTEKDGALSVNFAALKAYGRE